MLKQPRDPFSSQADTLGLALKPFPCRYLWLPYFLNYYFLIVTFSPSFFPPPFDEDSFSFCFTPCNFLLLWVIQLSTFLEIHMLRGEALEFSTKPFSEMLRSPFTESFCKPGCKYSVGCFPARTVGFKKFPCKTRGYECSSRSSISLA